MNYIQANINELNEGIRAACSRSGREPMSVKLVAVSKTVDVQVINESLQYGINVLGENKVQEIISKYDELDKSFEIHLIGHLQRNKVKYIIDKVSMIHSVDSVRLAEEIDRRAKQNDLVMPILIQVNVSGEASKFGVNPEELDGLLLELSKMDNIIVMGLMTMAPFDDDPEAARPHFRKLKEIFDNLNNKNYDKINMKELSMGMSGDYMVAIEEGATLIRVGSGIYGKRNYDL